jgi:hypothetical protein
LTFQVISTMTMSPNAPDLMYSAAFMYLGVERRWVPIWTILPVLWTAARKLRASAMVWAVGFST